MSSVVQKRICVVKMPELPEVEVVKQGLLPHVVGKTIINISCSDKKLRFPIPRQEFASWITGGTVVSIDRRAKYLLFTMGNSAAMIVHLGMTGKLGILPASAPPVLHDHVVFSLPGDMEMRYNDTRRFGSIRVFSPEQFKQDDPFKNLGPEPLGPNYTAAYMKKKAGTRLQPIKNFLMNSHVVVGIGNIYANEILFYSNIHPSLPIGSVSMKMWEIVVEKSRTVLERAIASGGSTISDFVNSSGQKGYFQLELMVYGRAGEPCKLCATPIAKQVIGGRSTFFCLSCQR